MTTKTKTKTATKRAANTKAVAPKRQKTQTNAAVASTGDERMMLPLRALVPAPENVRRYNSEAGLDELCANIAAMGLLQNLTGRKNAKGKYEIEAGARRLRALKELAKRGAIIEPEGVKVTLDYLAPVLVKAAAHNATEVSLAENIIRENMHVADEVEAFRKLVEDDGMTPEQIGDRFGKSHMTVRRRVKLAKVSPRIMDAFRAGDLSLQDLEAFALSDDHKAQEATFDSLPRYNVNPNAIRTRLAQEKIAGSHRFARFIGLDAYRQAGGTITRDLFSEDDDSAVYLDDKSLVVKLATAKLEGIAQDLQQDEGWKWFEVYLSDQESRGQYTRLATYAREQTDAEREEIAALTDFLEANEEAYHQGELDDAGAEDYEAKSERLDEIVAGCNVFKPEEAALAGIVVALDYQGELNVRRGLVRKEDAHDLASLRRREETAEDQQFGDGETQPFENHEREEEGEPTHIAEAVEEGPQLSQAVIEDLTKARTAALAVELAARPDVALACVVHALASRLAYGRSAFGFNPLAIEIAPKTANLKCEKDDPDNAAPFSHLTKLDDAWTALFPEDAGALWQWCLEAKRETLLAALGYLVGRTVNAVNARHEGGSYYAPRFAHAAQIAEAVSLDMTKWWKPSEAFFQRVPKAVALQAVKDTGAGDAVAKAIEKATKPDAIKIAQEHLADKGWLPNVLRSAATPDADLGAAEEDAASGEPDSPPEDGEPIAAE